MILEVDVQADAANAVAALEGVGDAAKGMATDVQSAASTADSAAGSMDGLAAGADAVDSKMGAATGSLGALAGGLEAAGFGGAATALQGVAAATDFASGAGGILNLVMDTQAAKFLAAKAQSVGHTVALGASKVATTASTAAQWLLNAAMSANPIGLIVVTLALMATGLGIAYAKSETFRDVVSAAMDVVKDAIDAVKDAVGFVIDAVKDMNGPWDAVKTAVSNALTPAKLVIDGIATAVQSVIDAVKTLIEWIAKIDFPDFPDLNPLDRPVYQPPGGGGGQPNYGPAPLFPGQPIVFQFTVEGDTDPDAAAQRIIQRVSQYLQRNGQTLSITA